MHALPVRPITTWAGTAILKSMHGLVVHEYAIEQHLGLQSLPHWSETFCEKLQRIYCEEPLLPSLHDNMDS